MPTSTRWMLLLALAASASWAAGDPARAKADAENAAGLERLEKNFPSRAAAHFLKAMRLLPDGRYSLNLCLALEKDDPYAAVSACDAVFKLPADDASKAKAGEISARLRDFLAQATSPSLAVPVYPGYGIGPIGVGMSRKELEALKLPMVFGDAGWVCLKHEAKNDGCTYDVRLDAGERVSIVEFHLFRTTQGAHFGRQFLPFNLKLDEAVKSFHCGALDAAEGGSSATCGDGFSVTSGSGNKGGVTLRQDVAP